MKIKKIKKLVSNLLIKNYTHSKVKKSTKLRIRIEKKKNRIIRFNQRDWLKSCIDMNTELKKKAKINFKKYISS